MPFEQKQTVTILIVDDDREDCEIAEKALRQNHLLNDIRFLEDGEDLLDYLYHRGNYANTDANPRPGLILLDLNMPGMDGREALQHIKTDQALKSIPIVILTTSQEEEDICRAYQLGVNSFITKPVTFEGLVEAMKRFKQYWFELVELPGLTSEYRTEMNEPSMKRG